MLYPERDTLPDASGPWLSKQGVTEESVLFLFPGVTICSAYHCIYAAVRVSLFLQ